MRPAAEIASLLAAAYENSLDVTGCLAGIKRIAAFLQERHEPLAQIAALYLTLPDIADERVECLSRTDQLLKANFDPQQPRDEQGRWTDEGDGGEAPNIIPVRTRARPHRNPRAWEDFPNPDFRNRLAVAERTADRPHYGYREVHDSRDLRGRRNLALGRYQMTAAALQAAGMMDRRQNWTGKYRIRSQTEFLADPEAQERALSDYLSDNERQLRALGAFGQTIDGLEDHFIVTRAGLIAAAHREGAPATRHYLDRIAGHGYSSKDIDLSGQERAIETRLRTFSGARYE